MPLQIKARMCRPDLSLSPSFKPLHRLYSRGKFNSRELVSPLGRNSRRPGLVPRTWKLVYYKVQGLWGPRLEDS